MDSIAGDTVHDMDDLRRIHYVAEHYEQLRLEQYVHWSG
jgi:hypothetical protein